MSQMTEIERRRDEARARMRAAMMKEFCEVMRQTGLPPMAILSLAAQSVGAVYREVADAHSGVDSCPCGWHPHEPSDMKVLGQVLMTAGGRQRRPGLLEMQVAGSA